MKKVTRVFLGFLLAACLSLQAEAQILAPILYATHNVASGGGIAYVGSGSPSPTSNSGSGNYSGTYVGATMTHGAMVLCLDAAPQNQADPAPSPSYNGVAMTFAIKFANPFTGGRWLYEYYLLNPASGSNTLAITQTGGDFLIPMVAEYSGVKQTSQPDAVASGASGSSVSSLATSITVVNNGSWAFLCTNASTGSQTYSNGTGATKRLASPFGESAFYDSNGPISPGAYSMTVNTSPATGMLNLLFSLQPG
jgi:hypothetical protein